MPTDNYQVILLTTDKGHICIYSFLLSESNNDFYEQFVCFTVSQILWHLLFFVQFYQYEVLYTQSVIVCVLL